MYNLWDLKIKLFYRLLSSSKYSFILERRIHCKLIKLLWQLHSLRWHSIKPSELKHDLFFVDEFANCVWQANRFVGIQKETSSLPYIRFELWPSRFFIYFYESANIHSRPNFGFERKFDFRWSAYWWVKGNYLK